MEEKNNQQPISFSYETRTISSVHITENELDSLSDASIPFQLAFGFATTFFGSGLALFIADKSGPIGQSTAYAGYWGLCFLVSIIFGLLAWISHYNARKLKLKIIGKKVPNKKTRK